MTKREYPYRGEPIVTCKADGCRELIYFFEIPTRSGVKRMPIEISTHEPHWANCPQADQFRTRQKKIEAETSQEDLFS